MATPRRRSLPLAAFIAASLALMTGCGNSGESAISTSTPVASSSPATTTQPVTTPAPTNTVSGTVSDEQGNSADITVGVGSPQSLAKLSDPLATACNQEIANAGQSVENTVALPVYLSVEITSSLQTPLSVDLSNLYYLDPTHHEAEPLGDVLHTSATPILWALPSSNVGAGCAREGANQGLGPAQVTWNAGALTPHTTATWNAWLILGGVITPHDPTGQTTANRVLIRPGVEIAGKYTDGTVTPHGPGWVRCPVAEREVHNEAYLAVDPTTAQAEGCRSSS